MSPKNSHSPHPDFTSLTGHIEKIVYHNPANDFTVARFRIEETGSRVTITGTVPAPAAGEAMRITGRWEEHPRYGEQLKLETIIAIFPVTVQGIRAYLSSGIIKGVGPKTIGALVDRFREETLEVIEKKPQQLTEVKGVGADTALRLHQAWISHRTLRDLMTFLAEHGIDLRHAPRIHDAYGDDALNVLAGDPYRLVFDLPGIGFQVADAVMRKSGLPLDDPDRVKACVLHALREKAEEGDTTIPLALLCSDCTRKYGVSPSAAENAVQQLAVARDVVLEDHPTDSNQKKVYLRQLFAAEHGVAHKLKILLSLPVGSPALDRDKIVSHIFSSLALQLSEEQLSVLDRILLHRVAIITGGPGTGKTTLIRSVAAVYQKSGHTIALCAPTGRAARRLSDVTGRNASTIHRLLEYNPAEELFGRGRDNPLSADVIIMDEASMVDILLMAQLTDAVRLSARLIIVGDAYQLPSVGPGSVLSDLIQSRQIPTFELNEIFRQGQESSIILNAHRVRQGKPPVLMPVGPDSVSATDFYFIENHRPGAVANAIVEMCGRTIPETFGWDPIREIQVITPMHKGESGTLNLNRVLQQELNPVKEDIQWGNDRFRMGDKVMQLRNNYQKEVYNGEIGLISDVDPKHKILTIDYEGRFVDYDVAELDQISLAYAITVHKSQGSEYPAVIVPILIQHFALLQRNLLYTAITRGRNLVVLIGTQQALSTALKNDQPQRRRTGLAERICLAPPALPPSGFGS